MQELSEFARRLRAWRAQAGVHGRMTQEQLADRLGVSTEAVSKYERGQSYIRGDLEHRLAERLGWSRDEIVACRTDWEARRVGASRSSSYRILTMEVAEALFGSWPAACEAFMAWVSKEWDHLPPEFLSLPEVYVPISEQFPEFCGLILKDRDFVGDWKLMCLRPEDEARFRDGSIIEVELTVDRLHRPILPGTIFGYCPGLFVAPGHENCAMLMVAAFIRCLENLAARDIFFHGIGAISVSAASAQLCRDLGMRDIGRHQRFSEFILWELTGAAIPRSIFGRRSARVARAYEAVFGAQAVREP